MSGRPSLARSAMSKKLLSFMLAELGIVRIKCMDCKKIAEMSAADIGRQYKQTVCPFCRAHFIHPGNDNAFVQFSEAVAALQLLRTVEVEFVTEDKAASHEIKSADAK